MDGQDSSPLGEGGNVPRVSEFVPLTGEPLAVDLINTNALVPDIGWVDGLESLPRTRLWVGMQQHRLSVDPDALTRADVAALRQLREDVGSAVARARPGKRPPAASIRAINTVLEEAPAVRQLRWDHDALDLEMRRPSGAGRRLLTQVAEQSADLLADPSVRLIRDCAMESCVMLFYPSRQSRKWCSDAICGNRARVQRHYRKSRERVSRR